MRTTTYTIGSGFNGINILSININICNNIVKKIKDIGLLEQFNLEQIYNSLINEKNDFNKIKHQLIKDNVEIKSLQGINGRIVEDEYIKLRDSIT